MVKLESELIHTHTKLTLNSKLYNIIGFSNIYIPNNCIQKWNDEYLLRFSEFRVNRKPSDLHFENIYKQCAATKQWFSLDNFKLERSTKLKNNIRMQYYILRSSSWEYDYHNQTNSLQKFKRSIYVSDVKYRNMNFIKNWMYGDEQAELKCLISNLPIINNIPNPFIKGDDYIENCTFYLHHLKVQNGVSVTKDYNPAELIINPGLLNNINMLLDIMGTILVNDSTHKMIHSLSQNSDITYYKPKYLPFGMQSIDNWKIICDKYPILQQISYENFIEKLKN